MSVYLIHSTDVCDLSPVVAQLKLDRACSSWQTLVTSDGDPENHTIQHHAVELFRAAGLQQNERQTVFGYEDQLVALQLCLAQMNKETVGDFDTKVSDVLHTNTVLMRRVLGSDTSVDTDPELNQAAKKYTSYKKLCNSLDLADVLVHLQRAAPEEGTLKEKLDDTSLVIYCNHGMKMLNTVQEAILKFLCRGKTIHRVKVKEEDSQVMLEYEETTIAKGMVLDTQAMFSPTSTPRTPKTPGQNQSVTELYVEKIFLGYLRLLVNTRCELSLARVLNVPNRDLDHRAFTAVKQEAQSKQMSMYQTAVSHIMKVRLGGKSYAPGTDSALAPYVKGLAEFTDLMHKLQSIIEEDSNSSTALNRVINVLKNCILKERSNHLRPASVTNVADKLKQTCQQLLTVQKQLNSSPQKSAAAGGSMLGRQTLRVIRCLLDQKAGMMMCQSTVQFLSDTTSSQRTPVRFQSLISQFKSPIEASPESVAAKPLAERLKNKMNIPKVKRQMTYQSCLDWARPVHDAGMLDKDLPITAFIPSKTIVHPAEKMSFVTSETTMKILESINDQENRDTVSASSQEVPTRQQADRKKTGKRTTEDSTAGAPKPKKSKTVASKPKSRSKLKPAAGNGQQKLTSFFRI